MATLSLGDDAATCRLGARLAERLKIGDVVLLAGDLGAGKSTLARACLQRLAGGAIEVPSPTFTLVQTYGFVDLEVWHVDLYRLERPGDVAELGLEEALDQGALLIEWPERLPPAAFAERLTIRLDWPPKTTGRRATFTGTAAWRARIDALVTDRPRAESG